MDAIQFTALAGNCAPEVAAATTRALVEVESSFNPHAIGVIGGVLERQPRNRAEALATATALLRNGWNISLGLAQINHLNLRRLGLSIETAMNPCANLTAMQKSLRDCFERAATEPPIGAEPRQRALRRALSCYYSGNFATGFRDGYVRKVAAAAAAASFPDSTVPSKEKP
jgi:type IV secretion system protein VirB1